MFDIESPQIPIQVDTLIHCQWLLLFEDDKSGKPSLQRYEKRSCAIQNGHILESLPTEIVATKYQADSEFNLSNHIVFPAFYNAHTSCAATLFQFQGLERPSQIRRTNYLEPLETKFLSDELAAIAIEVSFSELIRNGCAGFSDHYFFNDAILKSLKKHPFEADLAIYINPSSARPELSSNDAISQGLKLNDNHKINSNINWTFATDNINALDNNLLQRIATVGYETDIGLKCPLHSSKTELEESIRKHQRKPMQRLEEYGLLGPNTVFYRHHHLTLSEQSKLEKYNCKELILADTPSRLMGDNKFIGSDNLNTASFNIKNLLFGIKQRSDLTSERLLEIASVSSVNKKSNEPSGQYPTAHLCALEINDLSRAMAHDPIEQIVYNSHKPISHLWLAGKIKLSNGELTDIDSHYLLKQVGSWCNQFNSKI